MKTITENTKTSVVAGAQESVQFKIEANGKAFRTLIDGLYSDKIRSIIREIWSNAYDSHVEAGQKRPFVCHLPNDFEPYFGVRDYGVSLTNEDTLGLFSTVFASTKEDSNLVIGKFGLGSKSPFAYTDSYTVTCWLDGEKRVYSVCLNEEGIPTINLLHTEESDEDQGLEIKFPVNERDFHSFEIAARRVASGFLNVPTIVGRDLDLQQTKTVYEGKGWWVNENGEGGARQGCVLYPIDWHAVSGLTEVHRELLDKPFVVNFPIGSLDITASRESLSYDERTQKNIKVRLDRTIREIVDTFSHKITDCKTRIECARLIDDGLGEEHLPWAVKQEIIDNTKFKGKNPSRTIQWRSMTHKMLRVCVLDHHDFRRRKTVKWESSNSVHINKERKYHILLDGAGSKTTFRDKARIRHYFDTVNSGSYQTHEIIWVQEVEEGAAEKFVIMFGQDNDVEVHQIADLDTPPKAAWGGTRSTVKFRQFNNSYWNAFATVESEPFDGDWYVDLTRSEPQYNGREVSNDTVREALRILKEFGVMHDEAVLWGIPGTYKTVPAKLNMKNIFDEVQAIVESEFDRDAYIQYRGARQARDVINQSRNPLAEFWGDKITSAFEGCELATDTLALYTMIDNQTRVGSRMENIGSMMIRLGRTDRDNLDKEIEETAETYKSLLQEHHNALDERYPLLKSITTRVNYNTAKTVADYMGAIDLALVSVPDFAS